MTRNVLLIVPECDTWAAASEWPYAAGWAFFDGLTENGHCCTVLPDLQGREPSAPDSFLGLAPALLAGQSFDEAWIWCGFTHFDPAFWQWLEAVAPVRIGLAMNRLPAPASLRPGPASAVWDQLGHCTHVIVTSQAEVPLVRETLGVPAACHAAMVPERFVRADDAPGGPGAVLLGDEDAVQRFRQEHPSMARQPLHLGLREAPPGLTARFDGLHAAVRRQMLEGGLDRTGLASFTADLKALREAMLAFQVASCMAGQVVVNLPGGPGGPRARIAEAVAAGIPVLCWDPEGPSADPEFPTFQSPREFGALLDRLTANPGLRERTAIGARNLLLVRHTSRIRMRQYRLWLEQGTAPGYQQDFGYRPSIEENLYYREFFAKDPLWSSTLPNSDEQSRWVKIRLFLGILRAEQADPLAIVEVGCGRGWLSNLCTAFGSVLGIEPVGDVIAHARTLFPGLPLLTGSADLLAFLGHDGSYDVLVCSEVIEHVPYARQAGFVHSLARLVRPGGHLILTTPRMDIYPQWAAKCGLPDQPTEDWLTEAQLRALLEAEGCEALRLERAYTMDIYQVWLFRKSPAPGNRRIGVLGLGYVGLPLAVAMARACPGTVGFDSNPDKVRALLEGVDRTGEVAAAELEATTLTITADPGQLADCRFFIIAVPTPIDAWHRPDLRPVLAATETVGRALQPGAIVVYESTVYPGLTEEVCGPLLERISGLRQGRDFHLGYSPERINPGDREHTLARITKVVSGDDAATLDQVAEVYARVVPAGIHRAPSIRVAEAAKVIENTQRDLNIALMNELAIIFDRMGIRTSDVLAASRTKWNFLPFTPGLVGGHCIGVDPYYLTTKAEELGYHPEVILAGRRINDGMGGFVAQKTVKLLIGAGFPVRGARVGILGLAFKEDVPDLRNSRVPDIARELLQFGIEPLIHDPHGDPREAMAEYRITLQPLEAFQALDALIVAVGHRLYLDLLSDGAFLGCLKPGGVLVDIKSIVPPAWVSPGLTYWSL